MKKKQLKLMVDEKILSEISISKKLRSELRDPEKAQVLFQLLEKQILEPNWSLVVAPEESPHDPAVVATPQLILSQYHLMTTPTSSDISARSLVPTVASSIAKEILLGYDIDENGKINIKVNREQRPATAISGSQGDHVTAYTVLLQTICSLVEGEDLYEAPKLLYEATQCFFADLSVMKLKSTKSPELISFTAKILEVQEKFLSRNLRKRLTKHLRVLQHSDINLTTIQDPKVLKAIEFVQSQMAATTGEVNFWLDLSQLRNSIERGNQVLFAQLVVELGEQLLRKYNELPTAAFPKLRESKETNTGEGYRVKLAMMQLRLINKIIGLKQQVTIEPEQQVKEQLIKQFKIAVKAIIKAGFPQISQAITIDQKFRKVLKVFKINKETRKNVSFNALNEAFLIQELDIEKINTLKIANLFNDLFDFKFNKIRKSRGNEVDGQLVDDGTRIALKDPIDCLGEVVARHESFMFIAFKNLVPLRKKIVKDFYDVIISDPDPNVFSTNNYQGWGKFDIFDPLSGGTKNLESKDLSVAVRKHRSNNQLSQRLLF